MISRFQILTKGRASLSIPKRTAITAITDSGEKKEVNLKARPIYLDNQSTTPLDPRALDAMLPFMTSQYGNPHSSSHSYGWITEEASEKARGHVAKVIGADSKEIIFTSGATESNNLALKGVAQFYKDKKNHIITTQTEHKCVLDSCRALEQQGFKVTYLPVNSNGLVDIDTFASAITDQTLMASVMFVNNEIGVMQPIKDLGKICREKKVFFHTDIAQGYGKVPVDVNDMNIDLASISSHKIYGPKGIGALYVRRKPRVRLVHQISGGGQERGLRSGTLAPHLVVGFGEAARLAVQEQENDERHIQTLVNGFKAKLMKELDHVVLNGHESQRYLGNLNLSFACVEGESMIMAIKDVAVSSGSACTSASLEPSYVLRALGVDEEMAHTSIRFGIGRFNTQEEVDYVADLVIKEVNRLREMSPLWEMVQEGIDLKTIEWSQPH